MAKMGRPRKQPLGEDIAAFEQLSAMTEADEADFETFLTEIAPGTSVIDIFRIKSDGSRPRVGRTTVEVLREDVYGYLGEMYGTGRYDLQFKGADRRVMKTKRVEVEAPAHTVPQAVASAAGNGTSSFERELLLAMIAANKPPDYAALIQGMAAMQPKFDVSGMLTAMVAVFQALKPTDAKEDWLDRLPKVLELTKNLTPPAHEENLYTVAKDVGNKLIDTLRGNRPQLLPASGEAAPVENPQPAPALPQLALTEENLQAWIKQQLEYMKSKARAGKDVEFWVTYILENDEEPGCNAILIALERGVTFDMLLQFDSEIANDATLKTWFQSLYDKLQSELHAPMDTGGAGGNLPNPSSDANPSAPTVSESSSSGRKSRKPRND